MRDVSVNLRSPLVADLGFLEPGNAFLAGSVDFGVGPIVGFVSCQVHFLLLLARFAIGIITHRREWVTPLFVANFSDRIWVVSSSLGELPIEFHIFIGR